MLLIMKVIYKYELDISEVNLIVMPAGAVILTAKILDGEPYIWASVNTENLMISRNIMVKGTGHEIYLGEEGVFIDTIIMDTLVWHVFDRGEEPDQS